MSLRKSSMQGDRGFSLVEVSLAILVISIGLLTLFSMFPMGIHQGVVALEETQTSMFAAYVLDGIRANAMDVNESVWREEDLARPEFVQGLGDLDSGTQILPVQGGSAGDSDIHTITFPFSQSVDDDRKKLHLRYVLEIQKRTGTVLYSATLWVKSGEYGVNSIGAFKSQAKQYYTELFYSGML